MKSLVAHCFFGYLGNFVQDAGASCAAQLLALLLDLGLFVERKQEKMMLSEHRLGAPVLCNASYCCAVTTVVHAQASRHCLGDKSG